MHSFRHTYSEIRAKHRERVNEIKLKDYDSFIALRKNPDHSLMRPATASHPYDEVKAKIEQARQ